VTHEKDAISTSIPSIFGSRPGLIDYNRPAREVLTVQGLDCSLSVTGSRHLHKSESLGLIRVFIIDDVDGFNLA
jgi:hypothetical protein